MSDAFPMRIQKYLSRCGVGSRRECDRMVEEGKVKINDELVVEAGTKVEENDAVTVEGIRVHMKPLSYYLLDKPGGTVCVNRDTRGRTYVVDLIPEGREMGLFPVGRLDLDTTGLMIITNDGYLGNRISHPRFGVGKTYQALIKGRWDLGILKERIEGTVEIKGGGVVKGARILSSERKDESTSVEIRIHEGRKHVVKRIFLAIGSRVLKLRRTSIGDLSIDHLKGNKIKKIDRALIDELVIEPSGTGEVNGEPGS